ncbi:MAG: hypothetical protein ACRDV9_12240, partial [Acidimicrobiia bacterium]
RRESGDLPAELEHELDVVFARFVPAGAGEEDFEQILDCAASASFLDAAVPVASRVPGGSLIKRSVRKLVGWYVRYLAQQLTTLADILVRGLRSLGLRHEALAERVVDLERAAPADSLVLSMSSSSMSGPLASPRPSGTPDPLSWSDELAEALAGSPGRVCHAESGEGGLVAALRDKGVDAYGVEPAESVAIRSAEAGLDVRPGGALVHLRSIPDGALGGVVLSGCVDRVPAGVKRELVTVAASKTGYGGVVAVVSAHPRSWEHSVPPVEADLAPGRPLHPETWSLLLREAGLEVERVREAAPTGGLEQLPGDGEANRIMNANLDVLRKLLLGPTSYLVVARRRFPG